MAITLPATYEHWDSLRHIDHIQYGFTRSYGEWVITVIYDDGQRRVIATGGPVMHSDTIKAVAQALVAEMGISGPLVLHSEV